jgi:hypothetical protein
MPSANNTNLSLDTCEQPPVTWLWFCNSATTCPSHPPLTLQTSGRGAQHRPQGDFIAYRGFGHKGKEKQRLDKEIDQIGNCSNHIWVISNSFPKRKVVAAKIAKISLFLPSIYGQFEIARDRWLFMCLRTICCHLLMASIGVWWAIFRIYRVSEI